MQTTIVGYFKRLWELVVKNAAIFRIYEFRDRFCGGNLYPNLD